MSDSKLQVTLAAALGLGVGVGVGAVALTAASRGSRREGRRKGSAKLIGHLTSACCPSPPEPDSEPETESVDHEHREFVRVLRVRYEKEDKSPEFWTTADLEANSPIMFAIENVKQYFKEWQGVGHDPFWQRKSKKIVIAAVVCRSDNGLVAYRGMNTEVSLPSGSLCAERAAIARAASEWRAAHDIVAVAVLDPADTINPLWPCEVCQSWLAKLRDENSAISVIAFKDLMCSEFVVRVNGVLQPRPRRLPPPPPKALHDRIVLAEGVQEYPWEARHLVYVDGSWADLSTGQQDLLRNAAARGTHVLVGVHSDATLRQNGMRSCSGSPDVRLGRVLESRHVSSALQDAPWCVTAELISQLNIQEVLVPSESGTFGEMKSTKSTGAYDVAQDLGLLKILPASGAAPTGAPFK